MVFDGSSNEYKLDNAPTDCIQRARFGQVDNRHLLTASWDCSVRLYDVSQNNLLIHYNHEAPVLDATFQGNNICWSVGCDNKVKRFDFQSQYEQTVGESSKPIRCVEYIPNMNLVATGGWEGQVNLWDCRTADSRKQSCVETHCQNERIYSMSVCRDQLLVATSSRKILIWDLRNMSKVQRDSILKYQIRCIESFADETGYAVGSIEGRVAVEYLDPSPEAQKQKYAFKCHRNKDQSSGLELIWPINSISFHSRFNTFATGGSDGYVNVWDGKNKKRLTQFRKYPISISSLSFSPDGSVLAIACSDQRASEETNGPRDIPPDSVYIKRINEHEVRSKN